MKQARVPVARLIAVESERYVPLICTPLVFQGDTEVRNMAISSRLYSIFSDLIITPDETHYMEDITRQKREQLADTATLIHKREEYELRVRSGQITGSR
jgi:hypothetical protein